MASKEPNNFRVSKLKQHPESQHKEAKTITKRLKQHPQSQHKEPKTITKR